MKQVLLSGKKYKLVMQGLFCGLSGIYEIGIKEKSFPCTEVSFQSLSESEEIEALKLGFSPAIYLPNRLPCDGKLSNWWDLYGETAIPIFTVCCSSINKFWEPALSEEIKTKAEYWAK